MQIHSHLIKNEVIGFMAGYSIQCKGFKTLVITEVYPGESLNSGSSYNKSSH